MDDFSKLQLGKGQVPSPFPLQFTAEGHRSPLREGVTPLTPLREQPGKETIHSSQQASHHQQQNSMRFLGAS